jgi:serine phosphatase RsbU (regulator of sigma subunit)
LLTVSVILWLILLIYHGAASMSELHPVMPLPIGVNDLGYRLVFAAFLLCNAWFFDRLFNDIEKLHVTTMLWRQFMTGMGGVAVIMLVTFANIYSGDLASRGLHEGLTAFYYSLGLYATVVFFLSALFIFRRFILYPRTRRKVLIWRILLGFLGVGLVFQVLAPTGVIVAVSYIPFVILSLVLSANVRWIAYLNFNQKLRALGLFSLLSLVIATYLIAGVRLPDQLGIAYADSTRPEFLYYVIVFTISYSLVSILVLFFNLPTSSLFERESVQIVSFNKINQAIQSNLDFSEIINTLLDASLMASNARAGWIEMVGEDDQGAEVRVSQRISQNEIFAITGEQHFTQKVIQDQKPLLIRNIRKLRAFRGTQSRYRCLLVVPIISSSKAYGAVYVVNELANSLEDVTVSSVVAFAEQTGIALENAQLIKHSIETERYREQLKIAQEVQQKLLPQFLPTHERVEFVSRNENAYEVGGDYFDVIQPHADMFRVAVGDVSGKGTTAAFYMAEIKGIFHALGRLDLSPRELVATANQALSECMQPGFFMTLTYLQIDLQRREMQLIRAGHCPTFFFEASCGRMHVLREGTLGLGIVRNDTFDQYLKSVQTLSFSPGDLLVLYTDGINEARNPQGEEYGYDRLQALLEANCHRSAEEVADALVQSVKTFARSDLQDDYTALIIRFR